MAGAFSRPAWVQAAIDDESNPLLAPARAPFDLDRLAAEARLLTGLQDFGGDDWVVPLTMLIDSIDGDGRLHVLGRWRLRETILRLLTNRLKITAEVARDPAIAEERIVAPIIVTGSPRSGSSILHQLLAADSSVRAPRNWEFFMPVPGPLAPNDRAALIAMANREVRLTAQLAPEFDGMHEMTSLSTRECVGALTHSFRSEDFDALYPVPSYVKWLLTCDKLPAMHWHLLILQMLQRRTSTAAAPTSWVLKNPAYLGWMDELIATYPDATLVITHRDPLSMLSSVTSLYATLHRAHGLEVDVHEIGAELVERHVGMLDGLVDWVDSHPDVPIHHVDYDDFIADQLGAIAKILRRHRPAADRRDPNRDVRPPADPSAGSPRRPPTLLRGTRPRLRRHPAAVCALPGAVRRRFG